MKETTKCSNSETVTNQHYPAQTDTINYNSLWSIHCFQKIEAILEYLRILKSNSSWKVLKSQKSLLASLFDTTPLKYEHSNTQWTAKLCTYFFLSFPFWSTLWLSMQLGQVNFILAVNDSERRNLAYVASLGMLQFLSQSSSDIAYLIFVIFFC